MAGSSRVIKEELLIPRKPRKNWNHNNRNGNRDLIINNSPDRSPIWIEPRSKTTTAAANAVAPARKVPVLYYLSRNSHLEHPHLIDVPLSSPHGLHLRDVTNTLNYHRGKRMANMYSWSFKRSYKNGYVWHDVTEDDLIQPINGHDYILKGSEILRTHSSRNPPETNYIGDDCSSTTPAAAAAAAMVRRRNRSWSSFDNPQEYLVVKCESSRDLAAKFAADAATQTEEQRRLGSFRLENKEHVTVELSREEMPSPPPSNSSSEVLEAVSGLRSDDHAARERDGDGDRTVEDEHCNSGRMKASRLLMHMITCGAGSGVSVNTMREVSRIKGAR